MTPQLDLLATLKTIVPANVQGLPMQAEAALIIDFKQLLIERLAGDGKDLKLTQALTQIVKENPAELSQILSTDTAGELVSDKVQLNIKNVLDYLAQPKLTSDTGLGDKDTRPTELIDSKPIIEDDLKSIDITQSLQGQVPFTITTAKAIEATTSQVIRTYNPDNAPEIAWKSVNGQVNEAVIKWHSSGTDWQVSVRLDIDKNTLIISLPEAKSQNVPLLGSNDILSLQRDFKEHMVNNVGMNIVWSVDKAQTKTESSQQDTEGRQYKDTSQQQQDSRQRRQDKQEQPKSNSEN